MAEFLMPSLGADMEEATLLKWRIRPGESVKRGQVVSEVDTAKGVIDLECFLDGVVENLVASEGQTLPVGAVMAVIVDPHQSGAANTQSVASSPMIAARTPASESQTTPPNASSKPVIATTDRVSSGSRVRISPLARRRAEALGIDVNSLSNNSKDVAITTADIEQAAKSRNPTAAIDQPPTAEDALVQEATSVAQTAKEKEPAASRRLLRNAIAAAMSKSKREIPHYYLQTSIDLSPALQWLEKENSRRPIAQRLLPVVLLLKATARAIGEVPELNGHWIDGELRTSDSVHIGFAIAMSGGGLVAPAIHDVAQKTLDQLMAELHELIPRARVGRLRSSEMTDPTITITSLGDLGVESVTGIIYPPQVALVGLGQIMSRPWVDAGQLCVRPVMVASLSADHRATDGLTGARFLNAIGRWLQEPQLL